MDEKWPEISFMFSMTYFELYHPFFEPDDSDLLDPPLHFRFISWEQETLFKERGCWHVSNWDQVTIINTIQDSFFRQSTGEKIQTLSLLVWFLGGLLNDPYVFLIGIFGTAIFYLATAIQRFLDRGILDGITFGLKSKLVFGGLAHLLYAEWGRKGPSILPVFSITFAIHDLSFMVLGFFLVLWIIGRSFDTRKWLTRLDGTSYLLLLVSGMMKIFIWFYVVSSVLHLSLLPGLVVIPFVSAILEPLVDYLFHKRNQTLSSFDMVISDVKFPEIAAKDTSIANIIYLSIGIFWGDLLLEEAQLTRAVLILMALFFFIQGRTVLQRFATDPLHFSEVGKIIEDMPDSLNQIDLGATLGSLIKNPESMSLNRNTTVRMQENAILFPLKEMKDKIEIAIVGTVETVQKGGGVPVVETLEGITSLVVPKKAFEELTRKHDLINLAKIDLESLGYPDISTLKEMLVIHSSKLKFWLEQVRDDLAKFSPTNLSIHTEAGFTKVNLGLIQVIEHEATDELPEFTRVKLPGIRVLETEKGTLVRLFGYIIFDHPRFNFVNLPGLTVVDFEDQGTLVNLMGMKIGDQLPPTKLDEVKELMISAINEFERKFDSGIGRLLANKDTLPLFNLSFNGEFHPMLASSDRIETALPSVDKRRLESTVDVPLLSAPDYELIEENEKDN